MSVYSQAWRDTPPAVRDFYVNYHRRFCAHSWKAEYSIVIQQWVPFQSIGWSFLGYSGVALAMANWERQTFLTGSFNPAIVLMTDDPDYPPPDLQPIGPNPWDGAYTDQFISVPSAAFNYPREKYKVRRSYWTGAPKKRRNL